jgi:hypothetical protein
VPQGGNTATVIQSHSAANIEKIVDITTDGYLILCFAGTSEYRRYDRDWRLYKYDQIFVGTELTIPEKVIAVVGDTLQLFNRSMEDCIVPGQFDMDIICKKGAVYPRYFEYTPVAGDVGTTDIDISVKNYAKQLLTKRSIQLITKSAPSNPSSMKRIAIFGDSLTQGGQYPVEVARRLLSSDVAAPAMPAGNGLTNIKLIGAMGEGNARYYGVGGWGWISYATAGNPAFRFHVTGVTNIVRDAVYSNNGHQYTILENNTTGGTGNILCLTSSASNTPEASGILTKVSGSGDATITFTSAAADQQNPLWDAENNKISFTKYINNIGESTVDCVYFLLGWNEFAYDFKGSFDAPLGYMKDVIDALHTDYPSAMVRLLGLQLPSLNGGLGTNYGASGKYSDKWWLIRKMREYNGLLANFAKDASYSSFVDYVDVASQFDSENNMPEGETMVNTRNTKTELRGTNGVHPAQPGYLQIADVVYRRIVYDFC